MKCGTFGDGLRSLHGRHGGALDTSFRGVGVAANVLEVHHDDGDVVRAVVVGQPQPVRL